jgi:hypothetical protein
MKYALLIVSLAIFSMTGFAADQTWAGKISDSICGLNHSKMGKMGENPKECVLGCVKAGGKYILVSQDKIFQIENQNLAGLANYAGTVVKATGELSKDGKSLRLSRLDPAR